MNVILFDDEWRVNLLPLTFTRPSAAIRIGILTIAEKWEKHLNATVSFKTTGYLSSKFPAKIESSNIFINGRYLPDKTLIELISNLSSEEMLMDGDKVVACYLNKTEADDFLNDNVSLANHTALNFTGKFSHISKCPDIFSLNGEELLKDFELITKGRKSVQISGTNQVISSENIFIEEGGIVECSVLNASTGPIYIGRESEIMEGSLVRGPFALCDHSQLKMGAKIYGATTIGPHCKVGGEVNNCVIFGYTNKAHDGFIGNSLLVSGAILGLIPIHPILKTTMPK